MREASGSLRERIDGRLDRAGDADKHVSPWQSIGYTVPSVTALQTVDRLMFSSSTRPFVRPLRL